MTTKTKRTLANAILSVLVVLIFVLEKPPHITDGERALAMTILSATILIIACMDEEAAT